MSAEWVDGADNPAMAELGLIVPDEQLADYRQWIDNNRRLRELLAELEALTLAIADGSPRSRHRSHRKPPHQHP